MGICKNYTWFWGENVYKVNGEGRCYQDLAGYPNKNDSLRKCEKNHQPNTPTLKNNKWKEIISEVIKNATYFPENEFGIFTKIFNK